MLRLALAICFLSAPSYAQQPPNCSVGGFVISPDDTIWVCRGTGQSAVQLSTGGSAVPAGAILLIDSGACPAGYSEVAGIANRMLMGTTTAAGNVGTTGGSDSITPTFTGTAWSAPAISWPAGVPTHAGTAASFTGTAWTPPALSWPANPPTFTGNALATHAHELPWQIPTTTTIRQIAVATFGTGTSRAATAVSAAGVANTTSAAVALSQAVSAGTPAGTIAYPANVPTIASYTPAGSVTISNQGAVAWPAGVPTIGAYTPAGSISAVDTRSAFLRMIACKKT